MATAPTSFPHHPRLAPTWLASAFVLGLIAVSIAFAAHREGPTTGTGETAGSGVGGVEVRHLEPFSKIDLAGANLVSIGVGAPQLVMVRGDDNLLTRVTTTVADGTLVVDNRGTFQTKAPMSVAVAVPRLTEVMLSGSGTITVADVDDQTFTAELSGSGTIEATGWVDRISATLSGTGTLRLNVIARHATAELDGTGTIFLHASESLDATITGTGDIRYSGSPSKINRNIMGAGTISGD